MTVRAGEPFDLARTAAEVAALLTAPLPAAPPDRRPAARLAVSFRRLTAAGPP
ncbi:hypothetical protein [Streptomyces sp. NPDC001665]